MTLLDRSKKVGETTLVFIALLGSIGTGSTYVFKTVYHKEIQEFKDAIIYMRHAKDTIIPRSDRKHSSLSHRLDKLEKKHSGGFAVGLRWDDVEEKMYFRNPDGKKYEAFRQPNAVQWQYIKDGVAHYVYN